MAQDAFVALLEANKRFDPARAPWKTFAYTRANGAMTDALRARADSWSRGVRKWRRQIEVAREDLTSVLRRGPTTDEIAARLEWSPSTLARRQQRIRDIEAISVEQSERSVVVPDWLRPTSAYDALNAVSDDQRGQRLRAALALLEPRDRWVAERYYYGGATLREIGEELGVNESRVSQLHARMLERLKPMISQLD